MAGVTESLTTRPAQALRSGRHRFRLTATDADGGRSPTRTLRFRIRR
jgi:hypothetical protein